MIISTGLQCYSIYPYVSNIGVVDGLNRTERLVLFRPQLSLDVESNYFKTLLFKRYVHHSLIQTAVLSSFRFSALHSPDQRPRTPIPVQKPLNII